MTIPLLNQAIIADIQAKIDKKTKPLGALGSLEPLALQLALITEQRANRTGDNEPLAAIELKYPQMIVFAGDHGINEENVSIAPSEVTQQMVMNFLAGGAAINCFCQVNQIPLTVVDNGILLPVSKQAIDELKLTNTSPVFVEHRQGSGTQNFAQEPAMSKAQLTQSFVDTEQLINHKIQQGMDILLIGEMGIANTSSAAAIMTTLTQYQVKDCIGRGTGISDEQFEKKTQLVTQGVNRVSKQKINMLNEFQEGSAEQVKNILAELGGFEIVAMASAILTAAKAQLPILIDGFIVSVAALAAVKIDKKVADYLIFSHVSQENAHRLLLKQLLSAQTIPQSKNTALLDLGLRLGEGTGAALALPLLQAAACFYNNMASFESAGVTV